MLPARILSTSSTIGRKTLTITGSTDGALTDYPMRVVVHYDAGADSGKDVYLGGKGKTDWSGIRFRAADGTWLKFWRETPCKRAVSGKSSEATYWVKVPSIPESPSTAEITLYWNIASVGDESDGANTFASRFFEDFDSGTDKNFVFGSDTTQSAAFCPTLRRWYIFGGDANGGDALDIIQWIDIDTWETGFVNKATTLTGIASAVVWHVADDVFYLYGGRDGASYYDEIQKFDPYTDTLTTLTETLTETAAPTAPAVYVPGANPKVYIFGGYKGSNTFTDTIWVHDTDAGTPLTDTTANLRTACNSLGVAVGNDGEIYLFGGNYYSSGFKSLDTIDKYDPSSESSDPTNVDTLTTRRDSIAVAANSDGSVLYGFGGYDSNTTAYKDVITKLVVSTGVESEITETLDQSDDDAIAFYDEVTDKIYAGPFVHSTGSANDAETKTIVYEFDPDTETLTSEPSLGAETITGWGKDGTGTDGESRFVGSCLRFRDLDSGAYGMSVTGTGSVSETGKEIFEYGISLPFDPPTNTNDQFYMRNSTPTSMLGVHVRDGDLIQLWGDGSSVAIVTAIPLGEKFVGGIVHDPVANNGMGEVNRANRTATKNYYAAGTVDSLRFNSSTAGENDIFAVHWVLQRPWTTNEPTYSGWAE